MLDTYPGSVIPPICRQGSYNDRLGSSSTSNYPVVYFGVFKDDQVTSSTTFDTSTVPKFGFKYYKAAYNQPLIISESNSDYVAGMSLKIIVNINFVSQYYPNQAKGFTLSAYSKQSGLYVLNEKNAGYI